MSVTIDPNIWKSLDKFFAEKTIHDVDRNTFLTHTLDDYINGIKITLVFTKRYSIDESDTYNYVAVSGVGAVFTIPCYWVSVPKELAMPYFKYIITDFYEKDVTSWKDGNNSSSIGNGSGTYPNNTGCGCPPCGIV